ncbi:MAG: ROK family protein [Oscillospiraceae bacterium]
MYVGIDVGGTNLKAGLVTESGELLATRSQPVGAVTDGGDLAHRLVELTKELLAERGGELPQGVGMGVPGVARDGVIGYTCNLPLTDIPMERLFRRELDVPVFLSNDANCAALGEHRRGAGRGCDDFIVLTLGTGIGGGLILNGKIYEGFNGMGGEVGHMVIVPDGVPCSCGRRGCWERYASATGLCRLAAEAMEQHPESALWRQTACVDGRGVFDAAAKGDTTALGVCRDYVGYLAAGILDLANLLQPERIALGGGLSGAPDALLLEPLQALVAADCYARHAGSGTQIVKAQLGNDAGIIGAALLGVQ